MRKRAIIIDDERLARVELRHLLADYPEIEVVSEAVDADEGLLRIREDSPDLVFLDIQMPGKSGFEMLEELEQTPRVIFTTAYDEYALKAFEVNALDYLVKPIQPARLSDALLKLECNEDDDEQIPSRSLPRMRLGDQDQVFVKDGEKCWFVRLSEVRLFESAGNYTRIFFGSNRPLILKSLNALEERLDERAFFRTNRRHIVNLRLIEKVESHFNGGLMLQ
ncbi:MAG: DNA-binding response regulator, partial [Chitinophagia bacterium]|nr:DNA-binding response regulator [Chitinophagia bacterium]